MAFRTYEEILAEETAKFKERITPLLEADKERLEAKILEFAFRNMQRWGIRRVDITKYPEKSEDVKRIFLVINAKGNISLDQFKPFVALRLYQEYLDTVNALKVLKGVQ